MLAMASFARAPFRRIETPLRLLARSLSTETSSPDLSAKPPGLPNAVRLATRKLVPYDTVLATLRERGGLAELRMVRKRGAKMFVALFDTPEAAEALTAEKSLTISGTRFRTGEPSFPVYPPVDRTREDRPPNVRVAVVYPWQYGATQEDVRGLASAFGAVDQIYTIEQRSYVIFKNEADAVKFVDAVWAGEGLRIRGHRVWANYNPGKSPEELQAEALAAESSAAEV